MRASAVPVAPVSVVPVAPVSVTPLAPVSVEPVAPVSVTPLAPVFALAVSAPALGNLASTGWPLDLAGIPLSGAAPGTSGSGMPFSGESPLRGGALPRHRHGAAAGSRAGRTRDGARASSGYGGLGLAPAASRPGHVARPSSPAPSHVPPAPRLRRHGTGSPRPARPAVESSTPAPPLSAPIPGGGAAAAAGASGGGAASVVLLTIAALLSIFLLSTRVSLDLSAWRSTLLSLRLERPG
jgi:hypothetical protein